MFSTYDRSIYNKTPLADVICQLRFPEILTINTNQPAEFQEQIRSIFPIYSVNTENSPPKVIGSAGSFRLEQPAPTQNHQFTTADGQWRINMTSKFISLACTQYTGWENFAKRLDTPLAAFIKVYRPAYFERIGLRYINFISRKKLGLENVPYCDLFQPAYLGVLGEDDLAEQNVVRCGVDTEILLKGGCHVNIHAGPGMVARNGKTDSEVNFVFDQDLYMPGQTPVNYAADTLESLHANAYPIFRGAITELLHNAMDPEVL